MDAALASFADRLITRDRSQPGNLSPQSLEAAWEQFKQDWESATIYENFLLDLVERIHERCSALEFIDTPAKHGTIVSDSFGRDIILTSIHWNGYWDSPIVVGPTLQYPPRCISIDGLTSQAFLERLPKHIDTIADKFVSFITERAWTAFARLEIPEGCASCARWLPPLRLIRQYVVDHDVFIARFDMLGGTANS